MSTPFKHTKENQFIFVNNRIGFCPCCMADPLCPQEEVHLDPETNFCFDCHNSYVEEMEFLENEVSK